MSLQKNRAANRQKRRDGRKSDHEALLRLTQEEQARKPVRPTKSHKIQINPLTEAQARYQNSIKTNTITFGIGPAGTGKTWLATMMAAQMLDKGEIERLIITRPAVEAGESMGFLPGEIDDKWAPYFAPVKAELEHYFGSGHLEYLMKTGTIETAPLAYLRGHTFKNCAVLFDEAQNATRYQMKMFLTRIGEESKIIIDGDPRQCDLRGQESGLYDAMRRLRPIKSVGVVQFDHDDIVRSGLCKEIVLAYEDEPTPEHHEITVEESIVGLRRTLKID